MDAWIHKKSWQVLKQVEKRQAVKKVKLGLYMSIHLKIKVYHKGKKIEMVWWNAKEVAWQFDIILLMTYWNLYNLKRTQSMNNTKRLLTKFLPLHIIWFKIIHKRDVIQIKQMPTSRLKQITSIPIHHGTYMGHILVVKYHCPYKGGPRFDIKKIKRYKHTKQNHFQASKVVSFHSQLDPTKSGIWKSFPTYQYTQKQ